MRQLSTELYSCTRVANSNKTQVHFIHIVCQDACALSTIAWEPDVRFRM